MMMLKEATVLFILTDNKVLDKRDCASKKAAAAGKQGCAAWVKNVAFGDRNRLGESSTGNAFLKQANASLLN